MSTADGTSKQEERAHTAQKERSWEEVLKALQALAREIAAAWRSPKDGVELVTEQRR